MYVIKLFIRIRADMFNLDYSFFNNEQYLQSLGLPWVGWLVGWLVSSIKTDTPIIDCSLDKISTLSSIQGLLYSVLTYNILKNNPSEAQCV